MRMLWYDQVDLFTERPFVGDPQGATSGRPALLTVAVTGAADHVEDVLVGGSVQPVLRGEPALED